MIYNEILLQRSNLEIALSTLRILKRTSTYLNEDPDDLLMQTSISETGEAVVEMYRTLQAAETAFQKLLANTIQAIENAGVSFDLADRSSAKSFNDLPYTPQYGR